MKISVFNRSDGQPMLKLEAQNKTEKKQLFHLEGREMHSVHIRGVQTGKAGMGNACGSSGDMEGINSLCFAVIMGGDVETERTILIKECLEKALNAL